MSGQQEKKNGKKGGSCGGNQSYRNNSDAVAGAVGGNAAAILENVAGLQLADALPYAPKPPPGTNGSPIDLIANQLPIKLMFKRPLSVIQYDVMIESQHVVDHNAAQANGGNQRRTRKLGKLFNRVIIDRMILANNGTGGLFAGIVPIYDSDKILYTKTALNPKSKFAKTNNCFRIPVPQVIEEEGDEPSDYIVTLKSVATLELDPNARIYPQEAIQFLDILFRHGPTNNRIPVGDKIFEKKGAGNRNPLPENKELAIGHYQSVRQTEAGLVLNVDRATCAFNVGGWMVNVFNRRLSKDISHQPRFFPEDIRKMTVELKFLRFKVTHLSHPLKQTINEVTRIPSTEITFNLNERNENGDVIASREISVANYFEETYKRLDFPNFPCLVSGNRENPRYFPLEVCHLLPDQFVSKRLTPVVQAEVTKITTRQKPKERFDEINNSVQVILNDGNRFLKEFGIDIISRFTRVTGRIMEVPFLRFEDEESMQPNNDGSWMMQRDKKKFLEGVQIHDWIVVDMSKAMRGNHTIFSSGFLENFGKQLISTANEVGMELARPKSIERHNFVDTVNLKLEFQKFTRNFPRLQLIVAIIPEEDGIYKSVKRLGDKDFGVVTQCVSTKNYNVNPKFCKLIQKAYQTNLILKINAKLNGINTVLDVNWHNMRVMFVGIDVTHPPPGDRVPYSIASCVASYDKTFVRYFVKFTVQRKERKEIVELDELMKDLLSKYFEENKYYPVKIIIYRDGVSEGEFSQVMNFEVNTLKKLFKSGLLKDLKYEPKLTYVVVQKRHNIRFKPVEFKMASKSGNIPAGTVVDTVVTDRSLFSFYLCSHNGLLGTSRPALYWVLFDENNFNSDNIQKVSFFSCFLVPRATRSVSMPAPVYFAHLSAFRGRQNLLESPNLDQVQQLEEEQQIMQLNDMMRVNDNLDGFMFFI